MKLPTLFLGLLAFFHGVTASRMFTAVPKHSRLRRREADFEPKIDGQYLVYADHSTIDSPLPLSALRLFLEPKLPILLHDDVRDHFANVRCDDGKIVISFHNENVMQKAHDAWVQYSNFAFVTSQHSCASNGEHAVYITSFAGIQTSSQSIALRASPTSLKNCTERMHVDLGSHVVADVESHVVPRFAKPQAASTTSSNYQTASPISSSLSFTAPTATASSATTSGDVSFSRKNTTLFPPDSEIVNFVPALNGLEGFELRCTDCSMTGRLELRAAGFSLDSNSDFDRVEDFFDDGFFEFNAFDVSANLAFEFDFQPGFVLPVGFAPELPQIPLTPFGIPGVLTFGPVLQLTFPMAITLNSPVKFTTGFRLTVPQNSSLTLNVSDITSSSSRGFQDATLDPLPFDVNAQNFSLNLTAGFRPQLLLAAGLGPESGPISVQGGVGVFLDLPEYTATITALNNVAENCEDPAPANQNNTRIRIEPSVSLAGGVLWELGLQLSPAVVFGREGEESLIEISRPLPSQCLLFDVTKGSVDQPKANRGDSANIADIHRLSLGALMLAIAAACFMLL